MTRPYLPGLFLLSLLLLVLSMSAPAALAGDKPLDWDKRLKKGRYELSARNVDRAIELFAEEVKKHPEAAQPHTELGRAYRLKGRLMEAKAEFRRATEVDPGYAEAYYELGSMEEYDKEYALSLAAFERYLQLAPFSDKKAAVAERIRFLKTQL